MKKIFGFGLFAFSLTLSLAQRKTNLSIIPQPVNIEVKEGSFSFNDSTFILVPPGKEMQRLGNILKTEVGSATGLNLSINSTTDKQGVNSKIIEIRIDSTITNKENYKLIVDTGKITIIAVDGAGVFYAIQTLIQLFPIERSLPVSIPCVKIEDYPRFKWRGMHLDVCRHFFPVEFSKKYIDIMAMYKLNTFHWHLTEDQGWRIEIRKYLRLTEVGAWRKETMGDGKPYGGYYTQDQIRDVVKYAKERYITIVPEIEMPGHALAALAAYPEYSCTGGPFGVGTTWGVFDDVYCAGNDSTFHFLEDILDEVVSLFPGEYIHIGGDEVPKTRWENCEKCQARIEAEGLKNEHELQSYFVHRIEKYLNSKGKEIIGWDEILEGGLAPNAAVMSWRGTEGGIAAAQMKHKVVMSPGDYCYFDHYQGLNGEPKAIGGYTPLEKVYSYEPVPDELNSDEAEYIIGAQANMWTEYIETPDQVEYMLLPRLCALSEVLWSPKDDRNYSDFSRRIPYHYELLIKKNINFRIPPPISSLGEYILGGDNKINLTSHIKDSKIFYTLNGKEPDTNSFLYLYPLTFSTDVVLKAKTFLKNGRTSPTASIEITMIDTTRNGLFYKYYEGQWDSIPKFNEYLPDRKGKIHLISLDAIPHRQNNFGLYLYGFIKIDDSGEYTFYITSDDGSKLAINNKILIDNDGLHDSMEKDGEINLESGLCPFAILYFDNTGGEELKVEYQGPEFTRKPIPADKLFFDIH